MISKHILYLLLLPALWPVLPVAAQDAAGDDVDAADRVADDDVAAADNEPGVEPPSPRPADLGVPDSETAPPDAAADSVETGATAVGDERITVLDQVVPVAEEPAGGEPVGEPPVDDDADDSPVGDEAVGPPAASATDTALSEREQLTAAFNRFREYREAGMLDEADNAAKRAVELSLEISGPTSNDTAKALTNLATVQYDAKQYDAAKQNFESAIDIYKETEDQLSARLVNPLRGLGAAQLESGRPDQAVDTYQQAVHISHVNEGPHNLDQVPILEALAETHLRLGDPEQAKDAQEMIYALNLRHLDGDSMNLIPTLMRRAAWQRRTGYVIDEQATYRRIIRILEEKKGNDDIALIDPLTKLAESYFYVQLNDTSPVAAATIASGEIFFKRAIRIAEENPESNWQILANTMLSLADYYNFRADQSRARRTYRDVWELLSESDDRLALRRTELEQVHLLNEDPIPQYVGSATLSDQRQSDREIREGSVLARYDVSSRGRMSSLTIIEVTPPAFGDMQDSVIREMRDRIYRPRFVDGEPVDTPGQMLTHRFFYLQGELDERLAAASDGDEQG